MDNLLLLCRRHHRLVHEGGFGVELLPDGEARFLRPDRRVLPQAPTLPTLGPDPLRQLTREHQEADLEIDARTNLTMGDGSKLDLRMAVQCFRDLTDDSLIGPEDLARTVSQRNGVDPS